MEYNKPKAFILTDEASVLLSTKHDSIEAVDSTYVAIRSNYFLPKGSTFTYKGITKAIDDDSVLLIFYTRDESDINPFVLISGTDLSIRVGRRAKELEENRTSSEKPKDCDSASDC